MFSHDSQLPSRMNSPWFSPIWVQRKLLKLIDYFDDYYRTSGSPFLLCFMAGKNRWGGKGIKQELSFLVQGITAYYESRHLLICLSLNPFWFSALCRSYMMWPEPGVGCIFMFPLEDVWMGEIICFLPSSTLPGLLGWCPSDAILLWPFLSGPHGPLQLQSLFLNDHGIQTAKQATSPALHQNSQSSRGSCPVPTDYQNEIGAWVTMLIS